MFFDEKKNQINSAEIEDCPDRGQGSLLKAAIFVQMKIMVQNKMVGSFCPALIRWLTE